MPFTVQNRHVLQGHFQITDLFIYLLPFQYLIIRQGVSSQQQLSTLPTETKQKQTLLSFSSGIVLDFDMGGANTVAWVSPAKLSTSTPVCCFIPPI